MQSVREALGHLSELRGDGLSLGWRSIVAVVLVSVLFLHGFDSSFVIDGYTMGVLGLLLVVALAGELESARVAGISLRFRKLALQQVEREIDGLWLAGKAGEDSDEDGEGGAGYVAGPEAPRPPSPDWGIAAQTDPTGSILAFFNELERVIDGLYEPLHERDQKDASLPQKVDLLARYGVIPVAEGRVLLDLFALRHAYIHGDPVDSDEALRLVAVGGRLLPALSRARTRIGRAFEERVGEILDSIPGILVARQQTIVETDTDAVLRPDFLILAPIRIVVEAAPIVDTANAAKRRAWLETRYAGAEVETVVVVVPSTASDAIAARYNEDKVVWVAIDDLKAWLEEQIAVR